MPLLRFAEEGIYCPKGNFHIDPWRPVDNALITHAHADHARFGHKKYLCQNDSLPILKHRLGEITAEGINYRESRNINGVKISFHPSAHIIGSAQIRVEYKGEIWVVSGDYKLENDGLSGEYEPVKCQHFVTESTFGLPVYKWPNQNSVYQEINEWWRGCKSGGKTAIISAYSLGKAQRILQNIDHHIGEIFTHGAIENSNEVLRKQGINLRETTRVSQEIEKKRYKGGLVICPPSALGTSWMKKFSPFSTAMASGWMMLRGTRRRRAADRGFILSDHADWPSLNKAVEMSEAENIYVTHGYSDIFSKWLRSKGLNAQVLETEFETDSEE